MYVQSIEHGGDLLRLRDPATRLANDVVDDVCAVPGVTTHRRRSAATSVVIAKDGKPIERPTAPT